MTLAKLIVACSVPLAGMVQLFHHTLSGVDQTFTDGSVSNIKVRYKASSLNVSSDYDLGTPIRRIVN